MLKKQTVWRQILTFNINFSVHTMSVRAIVVNILVDLNRGHVGVLDVKGRPLGDVAPEPGHLADVELLGLVAALLEDLVLVLTGVEVLTAVLDVKLGSN